jgi:membrane protein implicated in regulation of membrane protease activity
MRLFAFCAVCTWLEVAQLPAKTLVSLGMADQQHILISSRNRACITKISEQTEHEELKNAVCSSIKCLPYPALRYVGQDGAEESTDWEGALELAKEGSVVSFTLFPANELHRGKIGIHQTNYLLIATLWAICAMFIFVGMRTTWHPALRTGLGEAGRLNLTSSSGYPLGLNFIMDKKNTICNASRSTYDPCRAMSFLEFMASLNTFQGILFASLLMWIYINWRSLLLCARLFALFSILLATGHGIMAAVASFYEFLVFSYVALCVWSFVVIILLCISAYARRQRQRLKQDSVTTAATSKLLPGLTGAAPKFTTEIVYADLS